MADKTLSTDPADSCGAASSFRVADWRVEPDRLRIWRADSEVRLEPKVMRVLLYMAGRPGEVISREELEANVWAGRVVGYDAVANTIIKLRKAFADDSRHPRIIETIPKTGYRLIARVERSVPESAQTAHGSTTGAGGERSAVSKYRRPMVLIPGLLLLLTMGIWLLQPGADRPEDRDRPGGAALSHKPSIAVVPFLNLSADQAQEYFSDGLTEDLITDLSKVQGLDVMARNSVFAYKGSRENEQTIGRKLGVRYVLKGSVRRANNRVRLNVQLTDVAGGRNLWAERYDRELGDIFQIQDELAARIVSAMEVELAPADRQRLNSNYIASVEAYDEFLRGLDYHGRRSPDDSLSARAHFRKAIDLDPGFARAYAGLALAYSRDSIDGWGPSVAKSLDQAFALAQRALQLDASIPQLYFVMSQVKLFQRDYTGAIKEAEKAIVLNPSYADAYALLAWILHFAGRSDEGLKFMGRATRLNPGHPAVYRLVSGAIHYARGDLEQAVELLKTGAEINPNYQQLRVWLAAVYAAVGRMEEAQWEVEEILTINPDFSLKSVEVAFPFRDPQYRDRFMADLEKAGFGD